MSLYHQNFIWFTFTSKRASPTIQYPFCFFLILYDPLQRPIDRLHPFSRNMFLSTFTYVLASTLALLSHTQALPTSSPSPRYFPQGTISSPANGTIILPGQSFDFYYNQRGDYCLSSYNFSVWLLTSPPGSSMIGDDSTMTGHYFGRFSYSSISKYCVCFPQPTLILVVVNLIFLLDFR